LESDRDSSDDSKTGRKLGDELFDSDNEAKANKEETKQAAELNLLEPEIVQQIIETDSPELIGLLEEFQSALEEANKKIQPALLKGKAGEIKSTAAGMSYLEMKYNLLMSYCTFLAFYLLMKVEGKPIENHPVVFKLAHIKTLFEKLKPLDSKLQYQIDKMMRLSAAHTNATVSKTALKHKPNIADLEKGAGGEDSGEEFDEDDDMAGNGSDSDLEDDMGGKAKA